MTTLREAAQDSLRALLLIQPQVRGAIPRQDVEDAIDALKAALAEPGEYARVNPLGGPATMFDAIARRLRAGEPYDEVLADYGLQHIPAALAEPVQEPRQEQRERELDSELCVQPCLAAPRVQVRRDQLTTRRTA